LLADKSTLSATTHADEHQGNKKLLLQWRDVPECHSQQKRSNMVVADQPNYEKNTSPPDGVMPVMLQIWFHAGSTIFLLEQVDVTISK